jgi:hypothetical protein
MARHASISDDGRMWMVLDGVSLIRDAFGVWWRVAPPSADDLKESWYRFTITANSPARYRGQGDAGQVQRTIKRPFWEMSCHFFCIDDICKIAKSLIF